MVTVTFIDRSKRERVIPLAQPYELVVKLPELANWSSEEHNKRKQFKDGLIRKANKLFGRDNKRWYWSETYHRDHGHCLYLCFADKADATLMRLSI